MVKFTQSAREWITWSKLKNDEINTVYKFFNKCTMYIELSIINIKSYATVKTT